MDVPEVTPEEAVAHRERGAVWIDVRELEEWVEAHIADTVLVPMQESPAWVAEHVDSFDAPIVVSCRSGARSASVVAFLRNAGYANAVNLRGGILAWMREGRAVERT